MYLELADGYQLAECNYMSQPSDPMDYYLAIPTEEGGIVYVREDMLDDLPQDQWEYILDMQPGMAGLFGDKEARQARRAERQSTRARRREARTQNIESGNTGFNRFLDTAKSVTGNIFGGGQAAPQDAGVQKGITAGVSYERGFNWSSPVVLIGGILLVGGVAIAIASRQKKK